MRGALRDPMSSPSFETVSADLRAFVDERAWDAFHNPKDLALSLSIEAAELLEIFQWRALQAADLTHGDRQRIGEELADVMMYAMLLADKAGIDLVAAISDKLEQNRSKYPVEKARGRSDKYDKL